MAQSIKKSVVKGFSFILLSLSLLGLFFSACQDADKVVKPPKDLLSEEQFTDVMEKLFLIEGLRSMHTSAEHKQINPTEAYYNSLWQNTGMDKELFLQSFDYYCQDRAFMQKIYAEVAKRLKVKEDKIKSGSEELSPLEKEIQEQ